MQDTAAQGTQNHGSGEGQHYAVDFGASKEGEGPKVKDAQTGEEVKEPQPGFHGFVASKEWKDFIEDTAKYHEGIGEFRRAAQLRGKKYDPEFGTAFKHNMTSVKTETVRVLVAAIIPVGMVLMWEGLRLVWPRARKWPGLFKYKPPEQLSSSGRVVRLSAR